jgi:hypothetical protein
LSLRRAIRTGGAESIYDVAFEPPYIEVKGGYLDVSAFPSDNGQCRVSFTTKYAFSLIYSTIRRRFLSQLLFLDQELSSLLSRITIVARRKEKGICSATYDLTKTRSQLGWPGLHMGAGF